MEVGGRTRGRSVGVGGSGGRPTRAPEGCCFWVVVQLDGMLQLASSWMALARILETILQRTRSRDCGPSVFCLTWSG